MAPLESKAGNKYYAVAIGRIPGIYTTWNQCHKQINEYSGSCHGGFPNLKEAIAFMSRNGVSEDEIGIFGSRGKRYTLEEWIRNREDLDEELDPQVKIRPETTTSDDSHEQQVILQPLLAYIHYGLLSGTVDSVKKAVIGYYTHDAIMEAKQILFAKVDNGVIGAIKDRRDGDTRSKAEADVNDILAAMARLDKAIHTPIFAVPSYLIYTVPRSHPEELNSISVIDRLKDLEDKYKQYQESVDHLVSVNFVLKERMMKLEKEKGPSYASVISSQHGSTLKRTQLQQRQFNYGIKGPTKPPLQNSHVNADRALGTTPKPPINPSPLQVPETSKLKINGSTDNLDTISMTSDHSQMSCYQYSHHDLDYPHHSVKIAPYRKLAKAADQ